MKKSMFVVLALCLAFTAFAAETETECPAMNESRTKVIKTKDKADSKKVEAVQG
jgi:Mg2+/Co2+ transporter CorB